MKAVGAVVKFGFVLGLLFFSIPDKLQNLVIIHLLGYTLPMAKIASNSMEFSKPEQTGGCCWGGCSELGKFPAPKSSLNSNDRYHFCLEHIRLYNNSWDFFYKMDQAQIESLQEEMLTSNRPTWKFGVRAANLDYMEEIRKSVFSEFHGNANKYKKEQNAEYKALPKDVRDALKIMGFECPVTIKELKARYKALVKEHHPDVTQDGDEHRIKAINNAYSVLLGAQ